MAGRGGYPGRENTYRDRDRDDPVGGARVHHSGMEERDRRLERDRGPRREWSEGSTTKGAPEEKWAGQPERDPWDYTEWNGGAGATEGSLTVRKSYVRSVYKESTYEMASPDGDCSGSDCEHNVSGGDPTRECHDTIPRQRVGYGHGRDYHSDEETDVDHRLLFSARIPLATPFKTCMSMIASEADSASMILSRDMIHIPATNMHGSVIYDIKLYADLLEDYYYNFDEGQEHAVKFQSEKLSRASACAEKKDGISITFRSDKDFFSVQPVRSSRGGSYMRVYTENGETRRYTLPEFDNPAIIEVPPSKFNSFCMSATRATCKSVEFYVCERGIAFIGYSANGTVEVFLSYSDEEWVMEDLERRCVETGIKEHPEDYIQSVFVTLPTIKAMSRVKNICGKNGIMYFHSQSDRYPLMVTMQIREEPTGSPSSRRRSSNIGVYTICMRAPPGRHGALDESVHGSSG